MQPYCSCHIIISTVLIFIIFYNIVFFSHTHMSDIFLCFNRIMTQINKYVIFSTLANLSHKSAVQHISVKYQNDKKPLEG